VQFLRAQFRLMEDILRRFALYLALPLALCLLTGCWSASLCAGAMLLYAALFLGTDTETPKPAKQTLILLAVLFLLSRAVLLTQPAPLCRMAGGVMAVSTALAGAIRLCGSRFQWKGWALALPAAAAVFVLIALLMALPHGTALLLPLGFAGLISAASALLLKMQ